MLKLNHVNLTVSDVPGLATFFERVFAFTVTERRGNGNFAVLEGEDGFVLILMHGKDEANTRYPGLFHMGYIVADQATVDKTYERMKAAGYEPPSPDILKRGGDKTYGFYIVAPGNIVIEVSTPAQISG
jgi:catechol-2,3-dioxygenase